jgi:hypothetical protein
MADKPSPIELQKALAGVDYPARRGDLITHAQKYGADEEVLTGLRQIPDREYDGPNAVSKAFAETTG